MDRTVYLELIKKCSILEAGIMGIKKNVPENLQVVFDSICYCPTAYKLCYDNNGKIQHIAILHDLHSNCVVECDLAKINLKGENNGDKAE